MAKTRHPSRGEIWVIDLKPTRGREQAGVRSGLIVSVDPFNHGAAGMVVLLPITSVDKAIPFHIPVNPPEGGLKQRSFIKCDDIRSISKERLTRRLGSVSRRTLAEVEDRLRILLDL